jgi:ornithine cyclodeaminase
VRILSVADQERILTMPQAIDAVALALSEYSAGRADSPVRTGLPVPGAQETSLFMPALVEGAGGLGVKFVSVFPLNKEIGKKTIYGVLVLADPATAEPIALLEASYLTALRTGAASGLATRCLARQDSVSVALIGTGGRAAMQLRGVMAVRPIREVRLFNHHPDKAYRFAQALTEELGPEAPHFIIGLTAADAVRGADIVITATNSLEPVFSRGLIGPGVINPSAKVVVESREVAL